MIPALSMARILSGAPPEPPEMIAPACPMRRPGGAVCPAMNPITGEKKYEDLARKFHQDKVLAPLAEGKDILPGLHANTQIPKLIGLARLFREVWG